MAVSQTLRDQWKFQILAILKGIEETLTSHPDIQNAEAGLEQEYDREHSKTLALIIEAEVLHDQSKNLDARRSKILNEVEGQDHLNKSFYFNRDAAREIYEAKRHKAVLEALKGAIAEHPDLAERYARYKEVGDNLDLTLLLANTPTKLKDAMVRLCNSLGVDLPNV